MAQNKKTDKQSQNFYRKMALSLSAVTELVVISYLGFFLGRVADNQFNNNLTFTFLLSIAAVIFGFYRLYKNLIKEMSDE